MSEYLFDQPADSITGAPATKGWTTKVDATLTTLAAGQHEVEHTTREILKELKDDGNGDRNLRGLVKRTAEAAGAEITAQAEERERVPEAGCEIGPGVMNHPEGETRKDRGKQWLVGLGCFVVLSASISTPLLIWRGNDAQNNQHAATVEQDKTIIGLEQRNNRLEKQHGADIENESMLLKGIKKSDTELAAFAAYVIESNIANCANSAATAKAVGVTIQMCPALPPSIAALVGG